MRVFGFASSLVETLALGLQTYNRARYRQLVKRIGHVIRSAHGTGNVRLRKLVNGKRNLSSVFGSG